MSTSTLRLRRYDRSPACWSRLADYVELTKPQIAMLVLVTVAVAAFVASWSTPDALAAAAHAVGTALVAASASALQSMAGTRTDARMARTADRPLPAGRLESRRSAWHSAR